MILWRLAQRSNLDSSVPFHKVFELSYSAVSQWLSVYNKARVAWVPLTYSDKKHSPPTDKGYSFRQLATLRSSTQFLAWVTRWCLMGSWFYIRVQSKHQHGQVQPCCQLKSCVCVCVFKAISESMIHSIDQLGFSQPCTFPLFTDAVKRFDMGAYKSDVSLLAHSNTRCFRNHSKMDVSVQTRLFSLATMKNGDLQPKHLVSYDLKHFVKESKGSWRKLRS